MLHIISETKLARVKEMYYNGKFQSPDHCNNYNPKYDVYTEALDNKVSRDYKVGYASDSVTLIQPIQGCSWKQLQEIAGLTGETDSFYRILLAKNNKLYPALRSTASKNPLHYRLDYIFKRADKDYTATKRTEPTNIVVVEK